MRRSSLVAASPVGAVITRRRRAGAALIGLAVALALTLLSSPAFALCPNCLGQTRSASPTLRLLGAFLLVPFLIVYIASRIIRRACRPDPRRF
jgi:hypothetical protein